MCVIVYKEEKVQLTLDEKTLAYLKGLVETNECASLSHAVRRIVTKHMRERKTGEEHL